MSVQMAAEYSGYSLQYLRRLLRSGRVEGVKIGQLWLIDKGALEAYLQLAQDAYDQRFGQISFSCFSVPKTISRP